MKKIRTLYTFIFICLLFTEAIIALFVNDSFIRPYLGDVFVTMLICSFLKVIFPKAVASLPIYVLMFSVAVEIGQYFDIVKIMGLENNKFFSVLLGRTFSVIDIICYALGCLLFFIFDFLILKKHQKLKNNRNLSVF